LLSPLVLALVLWALAVVLFWRGHRRLGLSAGLLAVLGLWAIATPLVANRLAYSLERRFPAVLADQAPQAHAIVLLGGALSGARPPERPSFDLGAAADRVWYAAALFKAGKASWILVSGGNQPGAEGMQAEAEAMRSMLLSLGVPASAIRLEALSRNTAENAQQSLGLIQAVSAKRVLLVTSALHMPRALRTFQAALRGSGVTVLPATTDVEGLPDTLDPLGRWLPDAGSLLLSTRALKEYLGLAVLRLRGQ
jgi:uncharacterized SAM-binding protein YcdF (DUF218 family)